MSVASPKLRAGVGEHRASILVAGLSAAFGVALLRLTTVLSVYIQSQGVGHHGSVRLALTLVAAVFIIISVYVGAIVTTNTFATIIAGRTRTIALLRLIGSSAQSQRRAVARQGLLVGVIGSAAGSIIGLTVVDLGCALLVTTHVVPALDYGWGEPQEIVPAIFVILTTWLASWIGSRRVLNVTPIQATGAGQELSADESRNRPARNVFSMIMLVVGLVLIGFGVAVGQVTQLAVLVSLVGGIVSFTGLILGAHLVIPPVLSLVGRLFGRSAAARLAAANAVRNPVRSSRTTIGLAIGVTLVVMFVVASQSYQAIVFAAQANTPQAYAGATQVLTITTTVFSILVGYSGVIGAVGMVNNLSLSVLQRTRELGLLRALGFSKAQLRVMIVSESAQMAIAAIITGIVLGTFYGWAGAQSLLGSIHGHGGIVAPVLPWALFLGVAIAAAAIALIASIAPTRRATAVSPIGALAVE